MPRQYIADLPGGTATTTVLMTQAQSLKRAQISILSVAAGKVEVSVSPTSQIGTAQPTDDVLCRGNCSATAGNLYLDFDISTAPKAKVKPFQSVYIHQTGAANLGSITLI